MAQPAPENHERRRHERIALDVKVTMHSDSNFYTGFTQDISEGGVFIASHEVLPIGSEVRFSLTLGKGSVPCTGVVRWVREPGPYLEGVSPGMGVAFADLDDRVREAINAFIAERRESIFFDDDPL
jgi:uncharacterized protein (TIGR02266 family)